MSQAPRFMLVQDNFTVGELVGNAALIRATFDKAREQAVDCVVFPELALTGYPPEDLLARDDFLAKTEQTLQALQAESHGLTAIIGHPRKVGGTLYNNVSILQDGKVIDDYQKRKLPNYGVFDEKRYFGTGKKACVFDVKGHTIGLLICEDLWFEKPLAETIALGAECVISVNASPFHCNKARTREDVITAASKRHNVPILYVHQVGGQDELIFDGGSMVTNAQGEIVHHAPFFEVTHDVVTMDDLRKGPCELPSFDKIELMYQACVLGVRDYVTKNQFNDVLLGLSGGIDSALVAVIAADALGPERVHAVMLPSRYTSDMSLTDAKTLAQNLGIHYDVIDIEPTFNAALDSLQSHFEGTKRDTTEENMQARTRGLLLMALSNKRQQLLLTTGNKSEMAVGYATLYGDMCGAFAPIKDLYKTWVYDLSRFCNRTREVIPDNIITRPPSAELNENQTDQDSLPPYDVLDAILQAYLEDDASLTDIVGLGFETTTVKKVMQLVDRNEFKRRQAAPGVRVTPRAFGRDRRYPITNRFKPYEHT